MKALVTSALLLPLAAGPSANEVITVRSNFDQIVCIGRCIDYEWRVSSNGTVEFRTRVALLGHPWDAPRRYHVEPARYLAFATRLASIRPSGDVRPKDACPGDTTNPDVFYSDVQWSGRVSARLRSCPEQRETEVAGSAIGLLGIKFGSGRSCGSACRD